jgi:hypothetical protein
MAVRSGVAPRSLDVSEVRARLANDGALLEPLQAVESQA